MPSTPAIVRPLLRTCSTAFCPRPPIFLPLPVRTRLSIPPASASSNKRKLEALGKVSGTLIIGVAKSETWSLGTVCSSIGQPAGQLPPALQIFHLRDLASPPQPRH